MAVASKTLVPFKLTDIGEGIAEVELLKWFVKVTFYWHHVIEDCLTKISIPDCVRTRTRSCSSHDPVLPLGG